MSSVKLKEAQQRKERWLTWVILLWFARNMDRF